MQNMEENSVIKTVLEMTVHANWVYQSPDQMAVTNCYRGHFEPWINKIKV
jgi:hypothetical protein